MSKNYKKVIVLIFVITFVFNILPIKADAKTISQFQQEVDKYTADLQAKKDKIAKNDSEVAQIKKKISEMEAQIKAINIEADNLQLEIDESNEKIKKKTEESKKIIEYYQISNGENSYLEYAFGATDITDMVYRLSVIEQLVEYNKKITDDLKKLIDDNKQKTKELNVKKTEIKSLQINLENEKAKINADSKSIRDTMPSLEEQIKAAKSNVSYYKKLGCGVNEDIFSCQYRIEQAKKGSSSVPSVNGFFRPMEYGYITQGYGGYGGHLGMDLSSSNKTIPIYPIADGIVWYKGYDSNGALVVKIKHNVGGKYIYSTYAHMSSFGNISKGSFISHNTSLGKMGSTGHSTGPHLHMEITTCDWNAGGGCTWSQYQRSTINPTKYVTIPYRWNNR